METRGKIRLENKTAALIPGWLSI